MRVAFASDNSADVNEHFGHARYWDIYDVSDDADYVDRRKSYPSCDGSCGDFQQTLDLLKDCDALFVYKIGEGAAAYLLSHGVRVFEATGSIEEILKALIDNKVLQDAG